MCKLEIDANDEWVQFCMSILAVSGFGGVNAKVGGAVGVRTWDTKMTPKCFWIFLRMVVWMHLKKFSFCSNYIC
jgi:hypothetical protein